MAGFILWAIFMGVVVAVAISRGRSGIGWFFIGFFISPVLALILLAVLPDLKIETPAYISYSSLNNEIIRNQQKMQADSLKMSGIEFCLEIENLKQLKDKGVITGEEFTNKKSEIINDLIRKVITEDANVFLARLSNFVKNETLTENEYKTIENLVLNERICIINRDVKSESIVDNIKKQREEKIEKMQNDISYVPTLDLIDKFKYKNSENFTINEIEAELNKRGLNTANI